jgi:hypothetical protein
LELDARDMLAICEWKRAGVNLLGKKWAVQDSWVELSNPQP